MYLQSEYLLLLELEKEAALGPFCVLEARKHTFCYVIKPQKQTEFDLNAKQSNSENEVASALSQLFQNKMEEQLSSNNVRQYFPNVSHSASDHINQLCSDFIDDMKLLIIQAYNEQSKLLSEHTENIALQQEILHHAIRCREKAQYFVGQTKLLNQLRDYLKDPQHCKPFVIHGARSVGKSSTIAAVCFALREWFSADSVIVVRFLGISSDSADITSTIQSITQQICFAYGMAIPDKNKEFINFFSTLLTFRKTIEDVSKKFAATRPLFILLDGLDQLLSQRECLRAMWAVCNLPLNIHVVLSTVAVVAQINLLGALLSLVTTQEATAEVLPLAEDEMVALINKVLPENHRNTQSIEAITSMYRNSQQPLLLSLALQAASSTPMTTIPSRLLKMGMNVGETLCNSLDELSLDYGRNIVTTFANYLTAFPYGIHESEVLRLLTANESIMEDVRQLFGNHSKELKTVFPVGLLIVIKYRLLPFITESYAFGHKLLAWKQREYYDIASKYCNIIFLASEESDITEEATNKTIGLYEDLARFYGLVNGEFENNHKYCSSGDVLLTYRLPQLVKVFLPVTNPEKLCTGAIFNLSWLLKCLGRKGGYKTLVDYVVTVISLAEHIKKTSEENIITNYDNSLKELWAFLEFLHLAAPSIKYNDISLLSEILGRLPAIATKFNFAQKLTNEAFVWKQSHCKPITDRTPQAPVLLPQWSCLQTVGTPLRFQLVGPTLMLGVLNGCDRMVTFNKTEGVDVWNLLTGDRLVRFPVNREQNVEQIVLGHHSEFIVIGFYSHLKRSMNVGVWSTETGVELVSASFSHQFEAMALDEQDQILVIATKMPHETENLREKKPQAERCLLAIDVQSRNIAYTITVGEMHPEGITRILFVKKPQDVVGYKLITFGTKSSKDVAVWDLEAEEMLEAFEDVDCFIDYAIVVPMVNDLVACLSSTAGILLSLDLQQLEVVQRIQDESFHQALDFAVSSQGLFAIVVTKHHNISIWSLDGGNLMKSIVIPTEQQSTLPVTKVSLDPSEQFFCAGAANGKIAIVTIRSGKILHLLEGHSMCIRSLQSLPNGRFISAADDATCCIWQTAEILAGYKSQLEKEVLQKPKGTDQFEGTGEILTASHIYDKPSSSIEEESVSCLQVTSSGKLIITLSNNGILKCWNTENGTISSIFKIKYYVY